MKTLSFLLAFGASIVSVVSASQAIELLSDKAMEAVTAGGTSISVETTATLTYAYAEATSNNIAFAWVDSQGNPHAFGTPGHATTSTCSSCMVIITAPPPPPPK